MPGIADVQPKQISSLGQPLVTTAAPVVTPSVMTEFVNAFRTGVITANDIADRFSPEAQAKHQLAKEMVTPEAVESRKQVQKAITEKARSEHETALSKEFINAYLEFNLPLKKADGTPDYTGMAEVGQKYAEMKRVRDNARDALKTVAVPSIGKNKEQITRYINNRGEDLTEPPGQSNAIARGYQNQIRKAEAYLFRNDDEPEVPEGGTPPVIEVTPKQAVASPSAALPPPVTDSNDPRQAQAWLYSAGVMPQDKAINLTDQEALDIYQSYQQHIPTAAVQPLASPAIKIEPTATGAQAITIEPRVAPAAYGGEGLVTKAAEGGYSEPTKIIGFVHEHGAWKDWVDKAPAISNFRTIVASYPALDQSGAPTVVNDRALGASIRQMMSAGTGGASGRALPDLQLKALEEHLPLKRKIKDLIPNLLRTDAFDPETRQDLITLGNGLAESWEGPARGVVQTAVGMFKASGQEPVGLTADELRLVQGGGAGADSATTGAAPAAGNVKVIGGRKLQALGNGQYRIVE